MTFRQDGRTYEWFGGFGAIFWSRERGVSPGDVRVITGELFYAYMVSPQWPRAPRVSWTQPNVSAESIRKFKDRVFA